MRLTEERPYFSLGGGGGGGAATWSKLIEQTLLRKSQRTIVVWVCGLQTPEPDNVQLFWLAKWCKWCKVGQVMIFWWSKKIWKSYVRPRLHGYVFIWKRNDIVVVSPHVCTETMKTIMKTQTLEYAIRSGSIWKRNEMKTERFENVSVFTFREKSIFLN